MLEFAALLLGVGGLVYFSRINFLQLWAIRRLKAWRDNPEAGLPTPKELESHSPRKRISAPTLLATLDQNTKGGLGLLILGSSIWALLWNPGSLLVVIAFWVSLFIGIPMVYNITQKLPNDGYLRLGAFVMGLGILTGAIGVLGGLS